jgi:hypothetical protein
VLFGWFHRCLIITYNRDYLITRRASDLRQLEKNIDKSHQEANKKLRELATQEFACQLNVLAAATRFPKIGYQ